MKQDGVEAPITPVLTGPRRSRDRARIALVGAIVVFIFAAGVGLAGMGLISPPATPSPAPSAGLNPTTNATSAPSHTAGPLPPPTPNAGLGCSPVRLGSPPEIRLGAGAEDPTGVPGVPSSASPSASAGPSGAAVWPAIPIETALRMADISVRLMSEQDACMRYVLAEYMPTDPAASTPFPISFRTLNVAPQSSIVPLGRLPRGDWTVRVVTYFSTDIAGQEDGTVIERYFRVINADVSGPPPTPETPPAVPCAAPPAEGTLPILVLSGSPGGLVEGTPGQILPPVTPVRLGDAIEIRVVGDSCATSWRIAAEAVDGTASVGPDQVDNPTNDPFGYAQNRWLLHDLPTGSVFVTATIRFSVDVVVTNRWLLDVEGGAVPAARIVTPNGTAVVTPRGPCGARWQVATGTGGYDNCSENPLPSSIPTMTVAPETPLRVEVPGWAIVSWSASCGRSDTPEGSHTTTFRQVDSCDLGGRYADFPLPDARRPVLAVFLPRSSAILVRVYLTVVRGDDTVSMSVYVNVLARS